MTEFENVEVRCCCDPARLLGWLRVPAGQLRITFFGFNPLTVAKPEENVPPVVSERFEMSVAMVHINGLPRFAFNSNETPIEHLRRLPNFTENIPVHCPPHTLERTGLRGNSSHED